MPGGFCCQLYSTAIRALGYRFYISEVSEGGNLKRFCINCLSPTSYKCRKYPPKKNIISMLLFALSSLKVKEISRRRHWKNQLHPFKLSIPVGTLKGSRKALQKTPCITVPVLRKVSQVDWKHQPTHWEPRVNGHIVATHP